MHVITLLMVGFLAGSPALAATPEAATGKCSSLLMRQWSKGLDLVVEAAQTVAPTLPAKAHPAFFRTLDFSLRYFIEDWRAEYNERAIEDLTRTLDETNMVPSFKMQKDLTWQAERGLQKHRPDLAGNQGATLVLVYDRPLLLFVGAEETPREIPPHVLLVLHRSDPVGWFRDIGNANYAEWTPIGN